MLRNSRKLKTLDKKKYNLKFIEKNIDNAFASTYTRKGACECIVFLLLRSKKMSLHTPKQRKMSLRDVSAARECAKHILILYNVIIVSYAPLAKISVIFHA